MKKFNLNVELEEDTLVALRRWYRGEKNSQGVETSFKDIESDAQIAVIQLCIAYRESNYDN